jgi:two-component system nitrogen regulation sensor histidine kinase NtrY
MIAFDINKSGNIYKSEPKDFLIFLKNQKLLREVDEIHIISDKKRLIMSTLENFKKFDPPPDDAFNLVLNDDRPLKIINAFENKTSAILKLPNYKNTYIYVVKFL